MILFGLKIWLKLNVWFLYEWVFDFYRGLLTFLVEASLRPDRVDRSVKSPNFPPFLILSLLDVRTKEMDIPSSVSSVSPSVDPGPFENSRNFYDRGYKTTSCYKTLNYLYVSDIRGPCFEYSWVYIQNTRSCPGPCLLHVIFMVDLVV